MTDNLTIFANSSGNSKSAISVIRITGCRSLDVFYYLTQQQNTLKNRCATLANLLCPETNEVVDQVIFIMFFAPNSFTGEDILEIHSHGSRAIVRKILSILGKIKWCRYAAPGEFSLRAFLNEKMSLIEAENLLLLINTETEYQRKISQDFFTGYNEKKIKELRGKIIDITSNIEAEIEFGDEVNTHSYDKNKTNIQNIINEISNILKNKILKNTSLHDYKIVIVGLPNVGKSYFFNNISKNDKAIVSDIEGTTRDSNDVYVDISDYRVLFIDTPGIRFSVDKIEQIAIEKASHEIRKADMRIFLSSQDALITQSILDNFFIKGDLIIYTKIDKYPDYPKDNIGISNVTGEGFSNFIDIIDTRIKNNVKYKDSFLITTRQESILRDIESVLSQVIYKIDDNYYTDIISHDLNTCINLFGDIIGTISNNIIMDQVFSKFCIGK